MTNSAASESANCVQSLAPHSATVAIARNPHAKRSVDRNSVKKRRSTAKLVDPLDILTIVVSGPRGNGRFTCPLCASNFGRRCELKRHVAEVHTINGARRFSCKHPSCGKSFTRKDALAKHEIVKHQGKRRFICPTCSEKFTSRYDLSRHNIRVHSNVKKRFTCEFCSAGFSQKSQLTMHKGRVHAPAKAESPASERRTSMDSLAAVAVAIAEQEAEAQQRRHSAADNIATANGTPIHQAQVTSRDRLHTKRISSEEEAAAATFAADALLEAAAVLQPTVCHSSAPTQLTEMSDAPLEKPETHASGEVGMASPVVPDGPSGSCTYDSTVIVESSDD